MGGPVTVETRVCVWWETIVGASAHNGMRTGEPFRSRARCWHVGLLLLVGACTPGAVIGLRPDYPPVGPWGLSGYDFVAVESLQPTFRWEAFPRERDGAADPKGLLGGLTTVTYDLEIWLATPYLKGLRNTLYWRPTERVYAQRGLPENSHRIEQPLVVATRYFWTVRARFEINGEPRVTEWGRYELGYGQVQQEFGELRPHPLYYRFRTPAQPTSSSPDNLNHPHHHPE